MQGDGQGSPSERLEWEGEGGTEECGGWTRWSEWKTIMRRGKREGRMWRFGQSDQSERLSQTGGGSNGTVQGDSSEKTDVEAGNRAGK